MSDFDDDIFLLNGRVRPDVTDEATAQALRDSLAHARSTNWDSVRTPHLFLGLLGTPDAAYQIYYGFDVTLKKALTDRFEGQINYTFGVSVVRLSKQSWLRASM